MLTTQFSLVILGHISVSCSKSWYRKLELCVISFWFYCHRLWWSSSRAILESFLLYVFLAWIFSCWDLFQVTGSDASYIVCIISCPLSKSCSILSIADSLLHCWHQLMSFCFAFALNCFWLNFIVQFTLEFILICTDMRKVCTEDSDHVIS